MGESALADGELNYVELFKSTVKPIPYLSYPH